MRIVLVVHGFPPHEGGGAEKHAQRIARGLTARGHHVRVLTTAPPVVGSHPEREISSENGYEIHRISSAVPPDSASEVWDDNPVFAEALSTLIREDRPDLVHLFGGYLASSSIVRASKRHNLPVVVSIIDYWWVCPRITMLDTRGNLCAGPSASKCARCSAERQRRFRVFGTLAPKTVDVVWGVAVRQPAVRRTLGVEYPANRLQTMREALSMADAVVSQSPYMTRRYQELGFAPRRWILSRQGVDVQSCPLRETSSTVRVVYLGQVKPHKGVRVLLEAWSLLRGETPRQLTLWGWDTGEPEFGDWVRNTVGRIPSASWAGSISPGLHWQTLVNADLVVVPSIWLENTPNSILEAQAMGVPVIGTKIGGIPDMVRHEVDGLLVEPNSAEALASAMQRLIDDHELRRRLSCQAPALKTLEDEVIELEEVFRGLPKSVDNDTRRLSS